MDLAVQIRLMRQQMLTIENLWAFSGFEPNDNQRDAILHESGPLYLTAGPGSGKTRVLLWRTLNLIVFHGVEPEEIFLSTFTEKAAFQLKEGLRSLLGLVTNLNSRPYDLSRMYVGTVHSLCQRMLSDRRRFSIDRGRVRPPQLLDELGQYFHLYKNRNWSGLASTVGLDQEILNQRINQLFSGSYSISKHFAVRSCMSFFNRLSEERIDPELALERLQTGGFDNYLNTKNASPEDFELIIRLYSSYRESLQNTAGFDLTDFSLIQQEAFRTLEQIDGDGSIFKYVIVDEYQDTNTIQELIFFKLAEGHGNLCVVGDDDQALYRFRGATVENFVQFPSRCQQYLGVEPRRIPLSINYRSRGHIVDFYNDFIGRCDWGDDGEYRVDKQIISNREDGLTSVVASDAGHPDDVCKQIARLVRRLLDEEKVSDPNQIAFLFPSVRSFGNMNKQVERMKNALEDPEIGLRVYAPRAGRFLDVEEAYSVFGVFTQVFGVPRPGQIHGKDFEDFMDWLNRVENEGAELIRNDPALRQYVTDRQAELKQATDDWVALTSVVEKNGWDTRRNYDIDIMKRKLYEAPGLSAEAKGILGSSYLDRIVRKRLEDHKPLSLQYIVKRATSISWNVLDLFYRICGFAEFRRMYDLAEQGIDEGPVANLGLITQFLSRFMDEYVPLITAELLVDGLFQRIFFLSYLFALYRLGETEHEDADDPFPKGRIPFLTVHQAKGLEFPVVVMMSPRKDDRGPGRVEELVQPLLDREGGEPLDRMSEFDIMRMFYVALSRAKNLLVLGHLKSRGNYVSEPFRTMLSDEFPRIGELDLDTVPVTSIDQDDLPGTYSFTSDFLMYRKCPRQYMIFRKYGFVPSRSQTMFFGSLVHRTLEDLHHELIRRREQSHG